MAFDASNQNLPSIQFNYIDPSYYFDITTFVVKVISEYLEVENVIYYNFKFSSCSLNS